MNAPNAWQPPGWGPAAAVPTPNATNTTLVMTTLPRTTNLRIGLTFLRLSSACPKNVGTG